VSRAALGAELKAIRSLAGISQRAMGRRLGVPQMRIARIESGETLPAQPLVERWLKAAAADPETRARVRALLQEAHRTAPTWSKQLAKHGHLQLDIAAQERAAVWIRTLETQIVPGLLQTPEYARKIIEIADMTGEVDVDEAVAARMERQQILQSGRRLEFLIAESVLSWEPAPGVLPAQMLRIDELAMLDGVSIGLIPAKVRLRSWSPFIVYTPAEGGPYVSLELNHGPQDVRAAADVEVYERLWAAFAAQAQTL
jgi:transcriptional regulator with XRE-family HTH domain